jgi:serine/threonine-protein kinase
VKATPEFQALTRPGMVMGTPEYMAPEQAFSADQADARSDLYSVGVMLYEMLSGALPARGSLPIAVAHQVMTNKVRPLRELCPGLPQGLLNLVHRAMQPERSARFDNALEMRRALSAFAGELSMAGRVAASVALGPRSVQGPTGASGTEKVPAMVQVPVGAASGALSPVPPHRPAGAPPAATGEMSQFRGLTPLAASAAGADAESPAPNRSPAIGPPAAAGSARLAAGATPLPLAPFGDRHISRTAEMPERAGRVAPTLPTPDRPPPLGGRRRSGVARRLFVWLLCLGALAGAGFGVLWVLIEAGVVQLYPNPGPPPPMPQPQGLGRSPSARPAP